MIYRAEIDGLRAAAVIPVIFFHAGFDTFSGGFVGVDVFFVISGYLITSIIMTEKEAGTFSLAHFYERRVRRILPALFFVMAVSVPFSVILLPPSHLKEYWQSLASVATFSSNIFFWIESGYFSTAAELKPLLHTWSLAVEEQFYVAFPLFFLLAGKLRKRWIVFIFLALALLSLVISQWGALNKPSAAFFLFPTRGWELLIGSLVGLYLFRRQKIRGNQILSLFGFLLITYAVLDFDNQTPFPGLNALIPTIGTALIILFATEKTLVHRLLSNKIFVGVGLISYSAYLWHQPLFAFVRHASLDKPGKLTMFTLILVSMGLAFLSWRFVERPFRNKERIGRRKIFVFAGLMSVFFIVLGGSGSVYVGQPLAREVTNGRCNFDKDNCFDISTASVRVALWGDSFADAFSESLGSRLNDGDMALSLFIMHGCPSIINAVRNEPRRLGKRFANKCKKHNETAVRKIIDLDVDYVVLTSSYEWYFSAINFDGEPILVDADSPELSPEVFISARISLMINEFYKHGIRVIIVSPHSRVEDFPLIQRKYHFGLIEQAYGDYDRATKSRAFLLGSIKDHGENFTEIDGRSLFCKGEICPIINSEGKFLLYDGNHISTDLSGELASRIVIEIAKLEARND